MTRAITGQMLKNECKLVFFEVRVCGSVSSTGESGLFPEPIGFTADGHHGIHLLDVSSVMVASDLDAKYSTDVCRFSVFMHYFSFLSVFMAVWFLSSKCKNKLMHSLFGNGTEKADTPQELKNWFVAFLPEISGSLMYDALKHECGLVMIRKIRETLQSKMKKQGNDETAPDQPGSSSSKPKGLTKSNAGAEDDWHVVSRKKLQKQFGDMQLRAHEWNAPPLNVNQVYINSTGVAALDQYDAERKVGVVTSTSSLAVVTEKKLPGDKACQKVAFSCQDGDKVVPRTGFLYQLGTGEVSRVVDKQCPVLRQSCETAAVVCEIEQVEAPSIWKKLKPPLLENKPAVKDTIRGLLRDLGLQPVVDIWVRPQFVHESENGKMIQIMLRVETKHLAKYLQLSGQNGVYFQETRSRDSTTDHKVIWLGKQDGYKEALQKAAALSAHVPVLGLARTVRSRGVRVLKSNEGIARKHLRPDLEDDGMEVIGNWDVKGWPIGTVNKPDVKAALSHSWQVRPLFSKVQNGVRVWTVAAGGPPPADVIEIVTDAWGNTSMLEIRGKGRKLVQPKNVPVRHDEQQAVPLAAAPSESTTPASILEQMKMMMAKMTDTMAANLAQMESMVETVKQQAVELPSQHPPPEHADAAMTPASPANLDAKLNEAEIPDEDVEKKAKDKARGTSRTPRRQWKGTPNKSAGKDEP
eukprot:s395_g4.t1